MTAENNINRLSVNRKIIDYVKTGYFSQLVIDYLNDAPDLNRFYAFAPTMEGLKDAVAARKNFVCNRSLLVSELKKQYQGIEISDKTAYNLNALEKENCFTITTAHQPNIFTGPLYFIYKILHAVKLAEKMNAEMTDHYFVPVYYMGSEDADLAELGHTTVEGSFYEWQTGQTGTVGRMKVDDAFLSLIHQMQGQLGVLPFGGEVVNIFKSVYTKGKTIQQATLELVNIIFSIWGVVVLNPDNAGLKKAFEPVIKRELKEAFSHAAVSESIAKFPKKYKVQASGREINLFYLLKDRRERIEWENGRFVVKAMGLEFTLEAMEKEVEEFPDRFSGNVILRGLFQETILPDIAFIGGGGELAYWLELKQVFEAARVFYPVLILRNSFLLIEEKWKQKIDQLQLNIEEIFLPETGIMKKLVFERSKNKLSIDPQLESMRSLFSSLDQQASKVDFSLHAHIQALEKKSVNKLQELQKKLIRAEKKKFEAEQRQLQKLKNALFPKGGLQERVENFAGFYAKYGSKIIQLILEHSPAVDAHFTVLEFVDQRVEELR